MTTDLNKMSFDELVPTESKYLAKGDVGEDGMILTIKGFKREVLKGDDGDEEKTVLYWAEDMKPLILNKTNSQLIPIITGAKIAGDAIGKQVVAYNDITVGFGGRITGGIRLKKVAGAPKAAKTAPVADDDDSSEIPF